MYERENKTLLFNFLRLFLIIGVISFSSILLSSLYTTLNSSEYNSAFAFEPTGENKTNNKTATTATGFTADTDKSEYVAGEQIRVDGKIEKIIEGKEVRLDVYGPDGKPLAILYTPFAVPDEKGFFSYSGAYGANLPSEAEPGEYTVLVTYNKESVETKVMVK
jgi:hypothetical protein